MLSFFAPAAVSGRTAASVAGTDAWSRLGLVRFEELADAWFGELPG